jgi:hypothetical protein
VKAFLSLYCHQQHRDGSSGCGVYFGWDMGFLSIINLERSEVDRKISLASFEGLVDKWEKID